MHESSVSGIQERTWDPSKRRSDVFSRTRQVIESFGQPTLELLYAENKRNFPSDENDQDILNVFYAARLCFRDSLSSLSPKTNRDLEVGLDEVFQSYSKGERMQIVLRLMPEIVFVKTCTPSAVKMSINVDPLSQNGITGEEICRFIREFRDS